MRRHMKSAFVLFLVLCIISGALGFCLPSGGASTFLQVLSAALLILAAICFLGRRKIQKPVQSSFAQSFRSDPSSLRNSRY